ncbi:hypothetical protein ASD11_07140 [Aeromicrobium sp. Root495]|uniref:lytic murein transglycosylase n=1 Tax=Aeromicrobium sp. Root495 TaxID=1736550 RepID=UPI0006F1ED1C|nr:lytic murein transglycosylase [Aeromicrobium sp. Root495]KQY59338.1 hypothetical protein ASD11_07140 [Aeromicrobium sp. Root495]RYJ04205.1 MAG: murein transglycosylase [Actinomycetales bacterium]
MSRIFLVVPVGLAALALVVTAAWAGERRAPAAADLGIAIAPAAQSQPTAEPAPADAGAAPRPDPDWVSTVAARTGVTERALTAYAAASLRVEQEQPGCRLGWTTLAGIGQIETGHGQGGLDAEGKSDGAIQGPALDGTEGNAAITEDGAPDRARGPMQFIASTWRAWAADADGDGEADVDDVDDATLAAARYLCASGADLTTPAGWTQAVHSYNHSDEYVRAVLGAANTYAARSR